MIGLFEALRTMPSTNVRIAATVTIWLLMGLGEIVMFFLTQEWKDVPVTLGGLIVVMAGLDAAQFYGKRRTHQNGQTK